MDDELEIRKALAWSACHKMKNIWKSHLNRKNRNPIAQINNGICTTLWMSDMDN